MKVRTYSAVRKWVSVLVYGVLLGTVSRPFGSWDMWKTLLMRGGAYAHLCEENYWSSDSFCEAQVNETNKLFGLYTAMENLGSIIAGILLDYAGPRNTAFIGSIMVVAHFVLHLISGPKFDGFAAGAIVGALATNIVSFPSMVLEDMFPESPALAVTYSVGMQGLCTLIPPILVALWDKNPLMSFQSFWTQFIMFFVIPVCIAYVCMVPSSRYDESSRETLRSDSNADGKETTVKMEKLLNYVFSPEYLACIVVVGAFTVMGLWFQTAMDVLLGADIVKVFSWWLWIDMPLGILQGKLCDVVGTPVMLLIQICGYCFIFLMALTGPSQIHYLTAIVWVGTMAFTYNIKYTFAQEFLPADLRGTMLGIASVVTGIFLMVLQFIGTTKPLFWCTFFAMVSTALTPLALFLWYRKAKRKLE